MKEWLHSDLKKNKKNPDDSTRLTSFCLEIHVFTVIIHSASHCERKSAKQWRICDFRRVCYIQFHGNGTQIQQKAKQTKATVALYSVLALLCPTDEERSARST